MRRVCCRKKIARQHSYHKILAREDDMIDPVKNFLVIYFDQFAKIRRGRM